LALASVIFVSALGAEAQPPGVAAMPPYTVSVFAGPPAGLSNPDSITTANGNIYVVYANATNPDGTGGFSTIVEYSATGEILGTIDVTGKAYGLKYNPFDHRLWALRNEDSHPALTLIDPRTGVKTDYAYAQQPFHGVGMMILFSRKVKPSSVLQTLSSTRMGKITFPPS
jgi:YD repeat-containing protein